MMPSLFTRVAVVVGFTALMTGVVRLSGTVPSTFTRVSIIILGLVVIVVAIHTLRLLVTGKALSR